MGFVIALWGEFTNFIGEENGVVHWLLFMAALIVCFFLGKRERRQIFWPSVLALIFFFNPFFYRYVGVYFLSGVYWRLLWMLPVSFVIAYAVTRLVYRIPKSAVRVLAAVVASVCIFVTGKPVFSQSTYSERENEYELPQATLTICDYTAGDLGGWKGTIIVPNELLTSIRQYSSSVCLLYGRNFGGFISDIEEDEQAVYYEMSKEQPDVGMITEVARNRGCRYIVFNLSFHDIPEDLTEYGYKKVGVFEEIYAVYGGIE